MSKRNELNGLSGGESPCSGLPAELTDHETPQSFDGRCVMSVLDFNPRRLGSIEEYLLNLSCSLARRGSQSVLVTRRPPCGEIETLFRDSGATLETVPFDRSSRHAMRALNGLLQKYHPHVLHLHFLPLAGVLVRAACRSGADVFLSQHGSVTCHTRPSSMHRGFSRLRRWYYSRGAPRYIAPSDYIRRTMIEEGFCPRRVVTIHNGVNLQRHNPRKEGAVDIRARYAVAPTRKLVVHIAFAHKQKGIDDFVRSATVLRDAGVPFQYFVVGDGPLMKEYRRLSHELGCEDEIIFTGLVDGQTLDSLLAQCDLSCLACTWGEAFSLVVLESMAWGKPMVATNVGGTPEAIRDQVDGLLVPPGDWRAFGTAIAELLGDDDRRRQMGHAARHRAEEQFDVNRWVRRTLALYLHGDPDAPSSSSADSAKEVDLGQGAGGDN